MRKQYAWIAGILLLTAVSAAAGEADKRLPKPCVAVLAAEVVGEMSPDEQKALAGQLDTLLTESLARQKGFVTVDRQALDKVLKEHKAAAAGATKVAVGDVAESLRPFWSAGVLICARVDVKSSVLVVEAVSAQTGQLIASLYARWQMRSDDDVAKALTPRLRVFVESILRGIARMRDKPLLEISGKLNGGSMRLMWMVDDLTGTTGAKVAVSGKATWLEPRHPLVTKEERLLTVMGLTKAVKGDIAAGLSPVPQMRLTFVLTDSAKTGVTFEKTPISLKLTLRSGKDKPVETQISGEVGKWDACRDKAVAWVKLQLANGGSSTSQPDRLDDEKRARQLSREILESLADIVTQGEPSPELQQRIVQRALRAAHLDPTNEQVAFLVVKYLKVYWYSEKSPSLRLKWLQRDIVEMERYLQRFPKAPPKHRYYVLRSRLFTPTYKVFYGYYGADAERAMLIPPKPGPYPYVRIGVRRIAEMFYLAYTDRRYRVGGTTHGLGMLLFNYLIPCVPMDKLDEEHEFWREFYTRKIKPVVKKHGLNDFRNTRPLPWHLIDAAFLARKKDPEGVKEALNRLAAEVPQNKVPVWGGGINKRPFKVPLLLRAAGAKDWKTWRPTNKARASINISINQMDAFIARLKGGGTSAWDMGKATSLPARKMDIPKLKERHERWKLKNIETSLGVQGMFMVGDELWVVMYMNTLQPHSALFVLPVERTGNRVTFGECREIPWPERVDKKKVRPKYRTFHVTRIGKTMTVWIGTYSGLARFDRINGKWKSRWYTQRDGLPRCNVFQISSARNGASRIILFNSYTTVIITQPNGQKLHTLIQRTWALDPDTHKLRLLHKIRLPSDAGEKPRGLAKTKDGRIYRLTSLGREGYDVEWSDVIGFTEEISTPEIIIDAQGQLRLFTFWGEGGGFYERSTKTFKRMSSSLGAGGKRYYIFPFPEARNIFGRICFARVAPFVTLPGRWPSVRPDFTISQGQYLWIASCQPGWSGVPYWLTGYRPAPKGAKDWAGKDRWVGPFRMPHGGKIRGVAPYGKKEMFVATRVGIYYVNSDKLTSQAKAKGYGHSTKQWREQYIQRLKQKGWKSGVPYLCSLRKWTEAEALLDEKKAKSSQERLDMKLWRAHVLVKKGKLEAAVKEYASAVQDALALKDKPAEVFARMNQIVLLHKARRWREMLDLCEKVIAKFPQTKPMRKSSRLNRYINNAKQNLKKASKEKILKVKP